MLLTVASCDANQESSAVTSACRIAWSWLASDCSSVASTDWRSHQPTPAIARAASSGQSQSCLRKNRLVDESVANRLLGFDCWPSTRSSPWNWLSLCIYLSEFGPRNQLRAGQFGALRLGRYVQEPRR